MTCPQEPIPQGWRVWRGPVPTALAQQAMDIRDHVRQYARGTIAKTMSYEGQTVAFWVSSHTWTFRNGQLVTGLCIPGVSLLQAVPAGTQGVGGTIPDNLSTSDPTAAVYGADDVATRKTSWPLVALTASVTLGVVGLVLLGIKLAGAPRLT